MSPFMDIVSFTPSCFGLSKLIKYHSYLLVRHPDVMRKLRLEIDSALTGKDSVTRADLKQIDYLTNVLKESM